jgi:carbon storage regulator
VRGWSGWLSPTCFFLRAWKFSKDILDMLVLSRKRDQQIMVGDEVVITVVDVRGDKVRLGIEAPAHVPVHRQEIYDAIKANQSRDVKDPAAK